MREGKDATAAATLTIADADLAALVQGRHGAQTSTSTASCASTATCALAHKLGFLKDLV